MKIYIRIFANFKSCSDIEFQSIKIYKPSNSTRKKMNCQIEHLECQTDYIGVLTMG